MKSARKKEHPVAYNTASVSSLWNRHQKKIPKLKSQQLLTFVSRAQADFLHQLQ
jgi:hypothetical protein